MKRVTFDLHPMFDVPDDFEDAVTLSSEMTEVLLTAFAERGLYSISIGRTQTKTLREGICRVDGQPFTEPTHFPEDRELPDICPTHAHQQMWAEVMAEHRPFLEAIEELSDGRLHGRVEHTGGGTMTIVVQEGQPEPGKEWTYPLYMGLKEGEDEDTGAWFGSIGFYATQQDDEDGGEDIVTGFDGDNGDSPRAWAQAVVDHFNARQEART